MKNDKPNKSLLISKVANLLDHADLSKLKEALKILCTHQVVESMKPDRDGDYGGAYCTDCGADLGWYCPKSEDQRCHYESERENGNPVLFVTLASGNRVNLPADHNPDYETDDSCVFCHEPNERK